MLKIYLKPERFFRFYYEENFMLVDCRLLLTLTFLTAPWISNLVESMMIHELRFCLCSIFAVFVECNHDSGLLLKRLFQSW